MLDKFLYPGLWLMRQLPLATKLIVLAITFVAPTLVVLTHQLLSSQIVSTFTLWFCVICMAAALYLLSAFYRSFSKDLSQLTLTTNKLSQGDLRVNLIIEGKDELSALASSLGKIGMSISATVANVRSNAAFVAHSGKNLAAGNRELSERTEQQASNLEQTAASVEELSSTVQGNAKTAGEANTKAASVRDVADKGAATMLKAVASVEAIQHSTKRMDEIVGVIDGIAFQTNILALNAAVESARAGESGRGFAVVASEVRSLAQRSAESAKEIRQLIGASSTLVASSVDNIRVAGGNITAIVAGIRDVASNMSQISDSSLEQSSGLGEITIAMRQLDEITQRNAQMVENAVTQASNLEERASTLVQAVAMFKLQQGSPEEAIAMVRHAMSQQKRSTSIEQFLREINTKAHGYYDRDMYIFVLDHQGAYVAFGGNPAKLGTRVQDIAGIDGAGLLSSIFAQTEVEPGWVEYDITNPATGQVQAKMSYVTALGNFALGCGVYKNYVAS